MNLPVMSETFPINNKELYDSVFAGGDVLFHTGDKSGLNCNSLAIPSSNPVFINPALVKKSVVEDVLKTRGVRLLSRGEFGRIIALENFERTTHLAAAGIKNWGDIISVGTGTMLQIKTPDTSDIRIVVLRRGENAPLYPNSLQDPSGFASTHPRLCALTELWEEVALVGKYSGNIYFIRPPWCDDKVASFAGKIVASQQELIQRRLLSTHDVSLTSLTPTFMKMSTGTLPKNGEPVILDYLGKKEVLTDAILAMNDEIRTANIIFSAKTNIDEEIVMVDAEDVFPGDDPKGRAVVAMSIKEALTKKVKFIPQSRLFLERVFV